MKKNKVNWWKTVLKERVTGFDHRKPRPKKKKINNDKNIVIKIRTDYFDETSLFLAVKTNT